jgi:uridine kinase
LSTGNAFAPLLVAIVGGSGSGKTWLCEKLQASLGRPAGRLSLDDFFRDRSHLPARRRDALNFDRPEAIDWKAFERVLRILANRLPAQAPCYDFKTHCRLKRPRILQPKPVILVDGLWLLRRPSIRRLFSFRIFIECPGQTRLNRRLRRDLCSRGRIRASVLRQFRQTVEPMHKKYVVPQARWADLVLRSELRSAEVREIASLLKKWRSLQSNSRRSLGS